MRKPNLFIVGAPKCGTTSIYKYLAQHPDIYMSDVKDIKFFNDDLHFQGEPVSKSDYLLFFSKSKNEKYLGEVSPWNLFSKKAPKAIYDFNPDAKVIICIRNPVEFMYSLYYQLLYNGDEFLESFEEALEAETDRKNGNKLPAFHGCPTEGFYYRELANFHPFIQNYFDVFGNNANVIVFDELKAAPQEVCDSLIQFLGLDSFAIKTFKANPNKLIRNKRLRAITKSPPKSIKLAAKVLLPSYQLRYRVMQKLWSINTKHEKRPPLDSKIAEQLKAEFEENNVKLGNLIGRDLTNWSK